MQTHQTATIANAPANAQRIRDGLNHNAHTANPANATDKATRAQAHGRFE